MAVSPVQLLQAHLVAYLRDMSDVVRIASATRRSRGVACPLCRKVSRAEVGVDADEA